MIDCGTKVIRNLTIQNVRLEVYQSWKLNYYRNGKAVQWVETLYHVEVINPFDGTSMPSHHFNRFNIKTKKSLNEYLIALSYPERKAA